MLGLKPLEQFDNKEENQIDNKEENQIKGKTIPINAIITLSVLTFILTFLRKGAVDYLAALTSSFIFIVFTLVNLLALIHYFKKKTPEEQKHLEQVDKENPILRGFPWYSVLGLIIAIYNLKLSSKYLRLIA